MAHSLRNQPLTNRQKAVSIFKTIEHVSLINRDFTNAEINYTAKWAQIPPFKLLEGNDDPHVLNKLQ